MAKPFAFPAVTRTSLARFGRAALLVSAVALLPVTTQGLAAVDSRSGPQFGRLVAIYQLCLLYTSPSPRD